MCMEPADWTRLGRALAEHREAVGLTQEQAAAALKIGRSTVQAIEHGRPFKRVTPTIRAFARYVGWTEESPETVLAGGNPTRVGEAASEHGPPATSTAKGRDPDDLSAAVKSALRNGPLLDSRVIKISTPVGEVTATVVARGEDGMSDEDLDEMLRIWESQRSAVDGSGQTD